MTDIVPRWEWRTFGDSFGKADDRFASMTPDRIQESDEIYVLSTQGDASVKVRDELMDVKHLEATNDDGLEQWIPVLKEGFPLAATEAATLFEALGVQGSPGEMLGYDDLLATIEATPELRWVNVHKRRARYTVGGCMSELSEISADGHATKTIAVELEDPAKVIAAVRDLGLADRPNTCMARGLKALVAFE
jgi:exopolyphosphatase / guanosine-5'-triphosphate,3'-diphosphate pyrophosphatase